MLLGNYAITSHAIQQYEDRVPNRRYKSTVSCIKNDLRPLNIRKIITYGNEAHIFTKGRKEFIFTIEENRNNRNRKFYVLNTVIKRNEDGNAAAIEKHMRNKEFYEKNRK